MWYFVVVVVILPLQAMLLGVCVGVCERGGGGERDVYVHAVFVLCVCVRACMCVRACAQACTCVPVQKFCFDCVLFWVFAL